MEQGTEKYGVEAVGIDGMSITQSLGSQEDKIRHEALLMATEKTVLDHSGTRSPASRGGWSGKLEH